MNMARGYLMNYLMERHCFPKFSDKTLADNFFKQSYWALKIGLEIGDFGGLHLSICKGQLKLQKQYRKHYVEISNFMSRACIALTLITVVIVVG